MSKNSQAQGSHPRKIALPFVCVVFGLVGAVGNETTAHGRATGFGISVVVIFSYYLLNFISDALGVAGVLSFDVGLVAECVWFRGRGLLLDASGTVTSSSVRPG